MREPLAVTRARTLADAAAVQVAEVAIEAGVPFFPALGIFSAQVGDILDGGTKTRGTAECAVGAREARAVRAERAAFRSASCTYTVLLLASSRYSSQYGRGKTNK